MVQAAGLPAGKDPCEWNIENPAAITAVHCAYVEAGSEIVLTNTFGVNKLKYHGSYALKDLVEAAVANARAAITRGECLALNAIAAEICGGDAGEIVYYGLT